MRGLLSSLPVAALAFAAPLAGQELPAELAPIFAMYDADGDGVIARAEFPGSAEQFASIDRDRDGTLTPAELAASAVGRRLVAAQRRAAAEPRPRIGFDDLLVARLAAVRRFDRDRNGAVTRDEWPGHDAAFTSLDLDGDGRIGSKDARLARARAGGGDPLAAALPPRQPFYIERPEELFTRLDRDADGVLTEAELRRERRLAEVFGWLDRDGSGGVDQRELVRAARELLERLRARDRGKAPVRAYRVPFSTWDRDGDGRLLPEEFAERRYLFRRIDADRDGAVTRREVERYVRAVEGSTFFERFDLDGDGRVTPAEYGGPPGAFRRADRNGDGVVTRADR